MQQFHFISGLPRSGSTLLAGLFRQNPNLHAAMSSPVSSLMNTYLEQVGANSEFSNFFDLPLKQRLCRSIFDSYYYDYRDTPIIFDTNRMWTARLHQLNELFDDFKMICCVRNPAWIADSFEVIYRKNPFDYSRMYSPQSRQTVYSRCDALMSGNGTIGNPWTALKEAYYGEFSDKLLLIDYDLLTQYPERAMVLIYEFLELEPYTHDFDNVNYEVGEFDSNIGVKDLHTVKKKVKFTPRRSILPPDLFKKYSDMAFWLDTTGTSANIIASKNNQ